MSEAHSRFVSVEYQSMFDVDYNAEGLSFGDYKEVRRIMSKVSVSKVGQILLTKPFVVGALQAVGFKHILLR